MVGWSKSEKKLARLTKSNKFCTLVKAASVDLVSEFATAAFLSEEDEVVAAFEAE